MFIPFACEIQAVLGGIYLCYHYNYALDNVVMIINTAVFSVFVLIIIRIFTNDMHSDYYHYYSYFLISMKLLFSLPFLLWSFFSFYFIDFH